MNRQIDEKNPFQYIRIKEMISVYSAHHIIFTGVYLSPFVRNTQYSTTETGCPLWLSLLISIQILLLLELGVNKLRGGHNLFNLSLHIVYMECSFFI